MVESQGIKIHPKFFFSGGMRSDLMFIAIRKRKGKIRTFCLRFLLRKLE